MNAPMARCHGGVAEHPNLCTIPDETEGHKTGATTRHVSRAECWPRGGGERRCPGPSCGRATLSHGAGCLVAWANTPSTRWVQMLRTKHYKSPEGSWAPM